jgi:hypothetical protein
MVREFKTNYSAKRMDAIKAASAASLKGAIRAAIVRIVMREYDEAEIFHDGVLVAWVYRNGRRDTGIRIFNTNLL